MDSDNQLVIDARTDREALGRLYEMYYDPIYRYCRHRLFADDSACEAVSGVFLRVAKQMPTFRGTTQGEFRAWLYRIATNRIAETVRTTQRRRRLLEAAVAAGTLHNPAAARDNGHPDWPAVYQAMLQLAPREQAIITMRFFEGLSHDDIAEVLDEQPGTIRVALSRAMKTLKERLVPADAPKAGR